MRFDKNLKHTVKEWETYARYRDEVLYCWSFADYPTRRNMDWCFSDEV